MWIELFGPVAVGCIVRCHKQTGVVLWGSSCQPHGEEMLRAVTEDSRLKTHRGSADRIRLIGSKGTHVLFDLFESWEFFTWVCC